MDRFLDDNRIKAILIEENLSEEEIGSDEDDNEERVVNESDHDTTQKLKLVKRICKLTQMWTLEAPKKIMEAMNISFTKIR
jgi:hypothetical protein